MNYYGDVDRNACAWLRELIAAGLIPEGVVDERPIQEVRPADLVGFTHRHFFCGIAGWAEALRLAGWPRERECWTGSLPCQPFSSAGKRKGVDDERHLWPQFLRLIRECRPATCLGEQVDSADGREWLARVQADLESEGYAVGAPLLRLRASARPTSDTACSGWPSPSAANNGDTPETWQSRHDRQEPRKGGGALGKSLNVVAQLAGWTTPQASEPDTQERPSRAATGRTTEYLGRQVQGVLAGWATPAATDGSKAPPDHHNRNLTLVGMALASGPPSTSSTAGTEKPGVCLLNPGFSLWLQGFPAGWLSCGVRATASSRRRPPSSSERSCKPKPKRKARECKTKGIK